MSFNFLKTILLPPRR